VLADTAYDSDRFREFLIERGSTPVIKPQWTPEQMDVARRWLASLLERLPAIVPQS
jgi:hypothetical protein